jgi:hypothetical protein
MNSTSGTNQAARKVIFWLLVLPLVIVVWRHGKPGGHAIADAWVGLFFLTAAVWPIIVAPGQIFVPLRWLFSGSSAPQTVPMAVQIMLQLVYVVIAGVFWWHAALDFAAKR